MIIDVFRDDLSQVIQIHGAPRSVEYGIREKFPGQVCCFDNSEDADECYRRHNSKLMGVCHLGPQGWPITVDQVESAISNLWESVKDEINMVENMWDIEELNLKPIRIA